MGEALTFEPNFAVSPGATMRSIMVEKSMTFTDLSVQLNVSSGYLSRVLSGEEELDHQVASRVSSILGGTPSFWIRRQEQYFSDRSRIYSNNEYVRRKEWLRELPVKYLEKSKWITTNNDVETKVSETLEFFGVGSVEYFDKRYQFVANSIKLKTSPVYENDPLSVITWMRAAELSAPKTRRPDWSKQDLIDFLPQIKALSRMKDSNLAIGGLQEILAKCGVRVSLTEAPDGCRANGAVFLTPDNIPVLVLSKRYRTDDHFWFAVLHEIGHLVMGHDCTVLIESTHNKADDAECEANSFAARQIVPEGYDQLLRTIPKKPKSIMRLAKDLGVSPGLVVGQMQFRGIIRHNWLNHLKRRLF